VLIHVITEDKAKRYRVTIFYGDHTTEIMNNSQQPAKSYVPVAGGV